jgi:hypothetical protein
MQKKLPHEVDEKEVKRINETATDWTAVCPVCGEHLVGTIAELRKHKHG